MMNLKTRAVFCLVAVLLASVNLFASPADNYVHMDFAPSVYAAAVEKEHIPRLEFEWIYQVPDQWQSWLDAEVNTDSGKLESLDYNNEAYWNSRPPIDAPISIK